MKLWARVRCLVFLTHGVELAAEAEQRASEADLKKTELMQLKRLEMARLAFEREKTHA